MKKSLALFRKGFRSNCSTTPEFKTFSQTFKRELKAELESNGATNVQFNDGHFYLSGFYTVGTQTNYFSISDVRYFREEKILFRTTKDYKDYGGGTNRYAEIKTGMGKKMTSAMFQAI